MSQDVQLFFQSLDQDQDGLISAQDIYTAIKSQGWTGDYSQVETVFSKMDLNGDGSITFDEMSLTFDHLLQLVADNTNENKNQPDENADPINLVKETNNDMKPDTIENSNLGFSSQTSSSLILFNHTHSQHLSSSSLSSSTLEYKEEQTSHSLSNDKNSNLEKQNTKGQDQNSAIKKEDSNLNSDNGTEGEGRIITLEDMEGMKGIPPSWVSDESVTRCMGRTCRKSFTFLNRRHHCRHCGGVFCHRCTQRSISISKFGYQEPVRVCEPCHLLITKELTNDPTLKPNHRKYIQDPVTRTSIVSLPFSYTQASTEQIVEKT